MDATETAADYRFTFDVAGLRSQDLQVRVPKQPSPFGVRGGQEPVGEQHP